MTDTIATTTIASDPRERGAALVFFVICLVALIAVAASSTMLSQSGQRVGSESDRRMKAHYLADSGAQIANHHLRAIGGLTIATTVAETLAGGVADITVSPVDTDLYEVTSTGTFDGIAESVQMHVQFAGTFDMDGAIQVNVHPGVTVTTPLLPLQLAAATSISGANHDASGGLLVDQSQATFGVALAPLPGGTSIGAVIDVLGGATITGTPSATSNTVRGQREIFDNLLVHARSNADVSIAGGLTLGDLAIGTLGTAALPLLTYIDLGSEATLELTQTLVGHGTLVIEVGHQSLVPALILSGAAQWRGLIVVYFTNHAEVPGAGLVEMTGTAQIIGGLSLNLAGTSSTFTGSGSLFKASLGNASVRYCSSLLFLAPGIGTVLPHSARVVAYRRL